MMSEGENSDSSDSDELELLQEIPWEHHPLRAFLVDKLVSNDFPADYNKMGPFDVWNKYCDDDVFEGMEYDKSFQTRLLALRKQYQEGKSRAVEDLNAFETAKANHPPQPFNHRDEPQWSGSEAQRLLKIDIDNKVHLNTRPRDLYKHKGGIQRILFAHIQGSHLPRGPNEEVSSHT